MSSGLSMSSVNKIKELAGAREYGLALELVESQDLSKSLNPQFLRLCGEIYYYNDRFVEARRVLLMAHKLAPQAKRIMYSLMELYLKMGYKKLAKTYYDMYLVDADEYTEETKQLQYIYGKANKASPEELVEYLGETYNENIDYEWSYETFLVYTILDRQQEALSLALEYTAKYTDAPHCFVIADILEGNIDARDIFYEEISECEDDAPEHAGNREEERKLLEAYDLRMNPPEPEIISMVDDIEEMMEFGSKRKHKKFLKEKTKEELAETDNAESTDKTQAADAAVTGEEADGLDNASEADKEEPDGDEKRGFIKRAFSKLRLKGQSREDDETLASEDELQEASDSDKDESASNDEHLEKTPSSPDIEETDIEERDTDAQDEEEQEIEAQDIDAQEESEDDLSDIEALLASRKAKKSASVEDDFDEIGFEAEADSVDDFESDDETDIDTVSKTEQESSDDMTGGNKGAIVFEDAVLADADEDDIPIDDFTVDDEPDEFGRMHTGEEDTFTHMYASEEEEDSHVFVGEVEIEEQKTAEDIYKDVYDDSDEASVKEETTEDTFETTEDTFETTEDTFEASEDTFEASEDTFESYEEATEDTFESFEETTEDTFEEAADEAFEASADTFEETFQASADSCESFEETTGDTFEEAAEETFEASADTFEETFQASADSCESLEETTGDTFEEAAEEAFEASADTFEENFQASADSFETFEKATEDTFESYEEATEDNTFDNISNISNSTTPIYDTKEEIAPWKNIKKKSLDYPVFRSSLFPEYHSDETRMTRDMSAIEEKEQKLQENLRKEEQIQKEAEALLASLGIDISGGSRTVAPTVSTPKDTAFVKNEPSRDELIASLKIDSVKKNLLTELKKDK